MIHQLNGLDRLQDFCSLPDLECLHSASRHGQAPNTVLVVLWLVLRVHCTFQLLLSLSEDWVCDRRTAESLWCHLSCSTYKALLENHQHWHSISVYCRIGLKSQLSRSSDSRRSCWRNFHEFTRNSPWSTWVIAPKTLWSDCSPGNLRLASGVVPEAWEVLFWSHLRPCGRWSRDHRILRRGGSLATHTCWESMCTCLDWLCRGCLVDGRMMSRMQISLSHWIFPCLLFLFDSYQ